MPQIKFKDVSLKYPIYNSRSFSLRRKILNLATGGVISKDLTDEVTVRALHNVNFVINDGDRVGLIGHNGAGKTTLLRTIAGIFAPTSGCVEVNGRVTTVIDAGAGIDFELSGYENISRLSLLSGVDSASIPEMIPDIEEFTELGDFLYAPVRTYSAGMVTRLVFAIATARNPEILLLDEILGAGDAQFQEKAKNRIDGFIGKAKILVLASHSNELLKMYANRFFVLNHGLLKEVSKEEV